MHYALNAYFSRKQAEIVKMSQKCQTNLKLNCFPNISTLLNFDFKCNFAAIINATIKFETQGLQLTQSIRTMEGIREDLKAMCQNIYSCKLEKLLERNKGYEDLLEIYGVMSENRVPKRKYTENLSPHEISLFKYAPVSSADVERSFSSYSGVLTEKRRSFSFQNLKEHMIVNCNQ